MGMGYYDGDLSGDIDPDGTPQQQTGQQQPDGGFRQYLKKLEETVKSQSAQMETLLAESRQNKVADVLQAKGYPRQAAGLYSGDPAKVDEWLTTYGELIAKESGAAPEGGNQDDGGGQGQGAPGTTVPPAGQAQLQQFQQQGVNDVAPPQGTEAEQVALMMKMDDPAQLTQYLAQQGNQQAMYWNG